MRERERKRVVGREKDRMRKSKILKKLYVHIILHVQYKSFAEKGYVYNNN